VKQSHPKRGSEAAWTWVLGSTRHGITRSLSARVTFWQAEFRPRDVAAEAADKAKADAAAEAEAKAAASAAASAAAASAAASAERAATGDAERDGLIARMLTALAAVLRVGGSRGRDANGTLSQCICRAPHGRLSGQTLAALLASLGVHVDASGGSGGASGGGNAAAAAAHALVARDGDPGDPPTLQVMRRAWRKGLVGSVGEHCLVSLGRLGGDCGKEQPWPLNRSRGFLWHHLLAP